MTQADASSVENEQSPGHGCTAWLSCRIDQLQRLPVRLALSLFLRITAKGATANQANHVTFHPMMLLLAVGGAVQLLPGRWCPWLSLGDGPRWRAAESLGLAALDAGCALICAAWFWCYFADDERREITVLPFPYTGRQQLVIGKAIEHGPVLILLTVPVMMALMALFAILALAQFGHSLHLFAGPAFKLADVPACDAQFGNASHRIMVGLAVSFMDAKTGCLEVQASSPLGGYFLVGLMLVKALLAAVLFSVFVQFGGLMVRRDDQAQMRGRDDD